MGLVRVLGPDGAPVEVDDTEAAAGIADGRYSVGGSVRLVRRDGRVVDAPDGEAARRALSTGDYMLDTDERAEQRRFQREYGDRPVAAGVAGAARGATLGASDVIGADVVGAETLRGLQEANPEASIGGEVVGALAPLLIPGGQEAGGVAEAGALARLARLATAPVRASEALGAAAEAASLARLGEGASLGARVLRRAAGAAVGGAVEGAAQGAGMALSESALAGGDYDHLGERLVSGVGMGALVGAGAGGLLGGTLSLGVEAPRSLARSGADLFERTWRERVGTELAPGVADVWSRLAEGLGTAGALATGGDRRFIQEALSPQGRRTWDVIQRGDQVYEEGVRRIVGDLNLVERAGQHARDFWSLAPKRDQIARIVRTGDEAGQLAVVQSALADARDVADRIATDAVAGSSASAARQLRREIDAIERDLGLAFDPSGRTALRDGVAADAFIAGDAAKRALGRAQDALERSGDATAVRAVRDLYESRFRRMLEDEARWGAAAGAQREVNEVYTRFLSRRQRFAQAFLGDVARDTVDPFRRLAQADSAQIASFLRASGTAANDTRAAVFREVLAAQDELAQTMARHLDLPDAVRGEVTGSADATRRALATLDEVEDAARRLNQFREVERAGGLERALIAGGAGAVLGGPAGAALAAGLASPATSIRVLSALHRISQQVDTRIARAAVGFVRRSLSRGAQTAARVASAARRAAVRTSVQEYERRVRELAELDAPAEVTRRLAESTRDLGEAAPSARDAAMRTTMRGVSFLRERLPRTQTQGAALLPGLHQRPRVSEVERARWLRYARAVDDPLTTLTDLELGQLSPEAAEVLRAVYPRLHQQIVQTLMRELASRAREGRPMPYRDRLQLGLLLGVPTDPSLRPESIALLQSTYSAPPGGAAQAPRPPAPSTPTERAASVQTESQRLEARS